MQRICWLWLGLLAATVAGCGSDNPQPISSQEFYSRQSISESPFSQADQPGPLPPRETPAEPRPKVQLPEPSHRTLEAVRDAIPPSGALENPSTRPMVLAPVTQPATMAVTMAASMPAISPNQYMILGTVVAVVDGTPIFANKVLQRDSAVLRELAQEYDIQRFETAARDRIDKTTHELIYDQLEFAAADRELDSNDKQLAQGLTQRWRQRQITEAGGSLEVARRRSQAAGEDFQDRVEDQHRFYLVLIYRTRKIEPQVQVTATDMRRYYQAHFQTEFSKADKANVLIIHTDPSDLGEDLALTKIQDFHRRALAGEDFAGLAKLQSSSIFWEPRIVDRGSFALTKVEDQIWHMTPGQISDVIEDRGGYYIVKLISMEKGGVQPFEDEGVQDHIRQFLRSQQLQKLQQREMQKLLDNAVVSSDPSMIDAAVDMAMQNYSRWSLK